jgi:hypothetical protein
MQPGLWPQRTACPPKYRVGREMVTCNVPRQAQPLFGVSGLHHAYACIRVHFHFADVPDADQSRELLRFQPVADGNPSSFTRRSTDLGLAFEAATSRKAGSAARSTNSFPRR